MNAEKYVPDKQRIKSLLLELAEEIGEDHLDAEISIDRNKGEASLRVIKRQFYFMLGEGVD